MPRLLKLSWIGWFAIGLTLCCLWVGFCTYRLLHEPLLTVSSNNPMMITVKPAMSATAFAELLFQKRLISSKRWFLAMIRAQGLASQLKAGIYQIKPYESAQQLLRRVVLGDVLMLPFVIVEGTTKRVISNRLLQAPFLVHRERDWQVVDTGEVEGLLLADTYYYKAGSSSIALLMQAHVSLQQALEKQWAHRSPGLPYKTPYELLIVASILEKETALPNEKRLISGVVVNRLRQHMPLQMDPTVIYALGSAYSGRLSHDDLQIDSPYNTYRHRGLPPAPIAMIGRDALDAAAHPIWSDNLYFVAKGDGTHVFSSTYDQQKQAITDYRTRRKAACDR